MIPTLSNPTTTSSFNQIKMVSSRLLGRFLILVLVLQLLGSGVSAAPTPLVDPAAANTSKSSKLKSTTLTFTETATVANTTLTEVMRLMRLNLDGLLAFES